MSLARVQPRTAGLLRTGSQILPMSLKHTSLLFCPLRPPPWCLQPRKPNTRNAWQNAQLDSTTVCNEQQTHQHCTQNCNVAQLRKHTFSKSWQISRQRYLSCIASFLDLHLSEGGAHTEVSTALLADYLHAAQRSLMQDRGVRRTSPVMCIKALRWWAKHCAWQELAEVMQSPLVSAYSRSTAIRDKREAVPIPWQCWPHGNAWSAAQTAHSPSVSF